jgi:hypothetical protein
MLSRSKWIFVITAAIGLLFGGLAATTFASVPVEDRARAAPVGPQAQGPLVIQAARSDVSAPLRTMPISQPQAMVPREMRGNLDRSLNYNPLSRGLDPVIQQVFGPLVMPTPIQNVEGMFNHWGVYPPDTVGDVGPNHYVQMVNLGVQVWNKTGVSLYGPVNANAFWAGFGGECQVENAGDPIVLYDPLADRWLLSQFTSAGPTYYECVAISTGPDPTGSYYRYAFLSPEGRFPDYPKLGVWIDGYYMTTREFDPGYVGLGAYALERDQMLVGNPNARAVYFHLDTNQVFSDRWLPADIDGPPPAAGTPEYFVVTEDDGWDPGVPEDRILIREFDVDWTNPGNSTFTQVAALPTQPFDSIVCNTRNCIPQPGTNVGLDSLTAGGTGILFRLAYRNMGSYQTMVMQQTVDLTNNPPATPGRAGIRWYEVRAPGAGASIYQQGTFGPSDTLHRWMGSIAMDSAGNIALGYSVSSATQFPSIWYTGRLVTDTLGTLPQGEAVLINGSGSQTGTAYRWGDYSAMSVDPVDDCTFWYTNEYYTITSTVGWRTRFGSFKFPNCLGGPTPTATATPCTITFTDVPPTNPFYPFIRCLACRGIVSGYNDGTFRWGNDVTRGQLSKIIAGSADLQNSIPSTQQTFADVTNTNVFWLFIERLADINAISGYNCGGPGEPCDPFNRPYFRWGNSATRGQISKITAIAAGYNGPIPTTQQTFTDVPPTNPFWLWIEELASRNIISGYNCGSPGEPCDPQNRAYFRWGNNATRGQMSKIASETFFPNCEPRPTPGPSATPTPVLCPGATTFSGALTASDPLMQGRPPYQGYASSCFLTKSCSAPGSTAVRGYDQYTYTNSSGSDQCITANLINTTCQNGSAYVTAYLNTFDPANVCANYLADPATSGPNPSFSFVAPAGATIVFVVFEVAGGAGCQSYTLHVNPCPLSGIPTPTITRTATVTRTPTITPTAAPPTATSTPGTCQYQVTATTGATMIPATNDIGNHCDDCTTDLSLPFPVSVYGTPVTNVRVGSNGTLQFQPNAMEPFFFDGCLPVDPSSGGAFLSTLFLYYDDLLTMMTGTNTCPGCGIYTATVGSPPNRQYVIRWNTTYFNHNGEANFEAVLTEGSNTLSVIYGANDNNGAEAVAGLQRDLTDYISYSCNQPMLTSGTRLNYVPSGCLNPWARRPGAP